MHCTVNTFVHYLTVLAHRKYVYKAGSLKMNTALEYSTRVVQEGGRLNDLVHLTPLRIPLMNPPIKGGFIKDEYCP
jgi:hypothetical protein